MTATTRPAGDLPFLVRMAFFWNRVGPRARGYVPRQVGRLYNTQADYFIETARGAKLRIDMRNLDVYAPIFNAGGRWEPHVANTCARMLRPHEVFFDIGANAGIVTLEVSVILGGSVSVCAFEPQPSLTESLRRSITANRFANIDVFECLLSDYDGKGELYLASHAIHASMIPRERGYEKISCPVYKLDTLVRIGKCPAPDVIKIDTEGAELKVLEGMAETIRTSCPSLILEADDNMERFGYTASYLLDRLGSLQDYHYYSILPDGQLGPWAAEVASNVLAVSPAHRDRITDDWFA